jgi:heterodisulfide reductase subunit A
MSGNGKKHSKITVTINGNSFEAEAGQTILDLAKANRIDIPTLCYHEALEAYGGCRLCMVEVGVPGRGRKRLVTSCNYEVSDGLSVETDSERVRKSRRMSIELLLARCPEAEVLQKLAKEYGIQQPRFPLEDDDCILCGLCVRICRERMGVGVADFVGRGAEIRVDTPYHRGSEVCISCGACESVCPTHSIRLNTVYQRPPIRQISEFDTGLRRRPSIYIPFPQALPNAPVIDRSNCARFLQGDRGIEACGICQEACPAGAIDYEQKDQTVEVEAGAVILAPGFCIYDAAQKPELGFTTFPNVVSSLQFERILSASGPYMGRVLRPSDYKKPERIAFIQCVGSRDSENNFCSSVCCMYAIKEAIIAKEHEPELVCEVFFMDIRAHGKGFDAYYERAKELGIRFTRCRPSKIQEIETTRNLRIGYVDEDSQEYKAREFDLVILSVGLQPPQEAQELARIFGIRLDEHGFAWTQDFNPVVSSRDGVLVAGPFSEPKDIPETVMEASSAASQAMVQLAAVRGTRVSAKELPPERDVGGQTPRIGVFVCHCGKNIGGYVDVPSVRDYAAGLPNVVYACDNLYTCSSDTQTVIRERIAEHNLNRVIVASCSPRTHEPLFQQTIREAGLNPHLFVMANIRDQCSWIHMHERTAASQKAKDLVRMAVTKAGYAEPLKSIYLPVIQKAMVVGAGMAGLTAALNIADQGFEVFLVEKDTHLGGQAVRIGRALNGEDVRAYLNGLIARVKAHKKIKIYTGTQLADTTGFVGNYTSKLVRSHNGNKPVEVQIKHGVAVLATGAVESRPTEYLYGQDPRVKTLLELEQAMEAKGFAVPDNVVFIQCVGSREPEHLYCSRVCCAATIKNAIRLKELRPEANVFVLYRDIRTYGFQEQHYARARELGVAFVRYDLDSKPAVAKPGKKGQAISVNVLDPVLQARLEIPVDLLVLASRIDANPENERLSQLFKVPLNQDRFFLEAHVKLRPVEFATEGVYLAGMAHSPKSLQESISQAQAAASRAATIISKNQYMAEATIAAVNEDLCDGCGICVGVCEYNALEIEEKPDGKKIVRLNEAACKGCGACVAACPSGAMEQKGFKTAQILAEIDAALA